MPLLDFYVPIRCPLCSRESPRTNPSPLCEDCGDRLSGTRLTREGRCEICFFPIHAGGCSFCRSRIVFFDRHESIFPLSGGWNIILKKWKFENDRALFRIFVNAAAERASSFAADALVYIASGRAGRAVRSYQPCADLARAVGGGLGVPSFPALVKATSRQSGRGYSDRFVAITGALNVNTDIRKASRVILIEDVFTTGATANEAARVLKKNGVNDVTVLSLLFREDLDVQVEDERAHDVDIEGRIEGRLAPH